MNIKQITSYHKSHFENNNYGIHLHPHLNILTIKDQDYRINKTKSKEKFW